MYVYAYVCAHFPVTETFICVNRHTFFHSASTYTSITSMSSLQALIDKYLGAARALSGWIEGRRAEWAVGEK